MNNNFGNSVDTLEKMAVKNSSRYMLTTTTLRTQKVAQALPQGLAPSVLPYRFTVSHYANGVVWHSRFCPLLTSCSGSDWEGFGEFSGGHTKEPSVWLLRNAVPATVNVAFRGLC